MKWRSVLTLIIALACVTASGSLAAADDDDDGEVNGSVNGNGFGLSSTIHKPGGQQESGPSESSTDATTPAIAPGIDPCNSFYVGLDGSTMANACAALPPEATPPQITAAMVLSAVRRTAPPKSVLQVQPPNGRTLVNFETNFFTVQPEFTRTMSMLGQQVQLQIWPSQFVWRFGDGEALKTSSPGAKYPHLEITHNYLAKGRYQPRVDTVYAAQFRVGGGGWQPVNGTVTVAGAAVPLQAVEARPKLVG